MIPWIANVPFADQKPRSVSVRLCGRPSKVIFHGFRRPISTRRSRMQVWHAFRRPGLYHSARISRVPSPRPESVHQSRQPFFHGDQIDQAFKLVFGTNWDSDSVGRSCTGRSLIIFHTVERSPAPILSILLTKNDPRNLCSGRPDAQTVIPVCVFNDRRWPVREQQTAPSKKRQRTLKLPM